MRTGTRGFLPTLVGFVMVGSLLPLAAPGVALAAPTELFFSEYIEGSSNNKALEIYNGTGTAVDLTAGGYNVQMFFNGNPAAGLTINLAGTVANGDVFVLAQSSANATILAQADQTNGAGWFNGDDAVVLRKGDTLLDVIGQIGFDPGSQWGSGDTSTADNTLRRKPSIEAGDPNGADVFDPSIEWDGFATDTFDGLGSHLAPSFIDCTDVVGAPGSAIEATVSAADVNGTVVDISITGIAPVDPGTITRTAFTPATADGGTASATITASAATPAGAYTVTLMALNEDAIPQTGSCQLIITVDVAADCGAPYTPIYDIQGSGLTTPLAGQNVTTQGVVVGDFEGPTTVGLQGIYLQDATGDDNEATSDGIFVFTGNTDNDLAAGDVVRVTGTAGEFSGQTQLSGSLIIVDCETTATITPVDLALPVTTLDDFEPYEGMLVRFAQALVIAEYFNYDRFGEIVLALPLAGEARPFTPTSVEEPGTDAQERLLANQLRRITLDDGLGVQNPNFTRHPNGGAFTLENRFRGGDTVANTVGVLGSGFGLYRIQPTGPADYTAVNHRPEAPADVGGRLTVAAFNALNFFLTIDAGPDICGPLQDQECRGADDMEEFTRQRTKLVEALVGIDADVVGLNEMENTAGVDPLADADGLASGLNDHFGAGTYDSIDTGVIGSDAIRVGILYMPASVTPVGEFEILDSSVDPRFDDSLSRPALAQTFQENATGERFTVVVNHLKSKGSDCNHVGDPDTGDGQGNCNLTREAAAQALVDWLATDPTASSDPDFLITGDLNSYAREDPIDAIQAGPDGIAGTSDDYTNLIEDYVGSEAYSFVFDGMAGYLDHALSNASLTPQVTGVTEWHINADEPDLLDYDTTFKSPEQDALFEPNAFRSSDHDPVIVGLDLAPATAARINGGGTFADGSFEFSAQYNVKRGVPTLFGNTAFSLTSGVNFASTNYNWLQVSGSEGLLRGAGTVNGTPGYRFYLAVSDGGSPGAGKDEIRIKIVQIATGDVVYDSQPGEPVTVAPTSSLTSGNLKVIAPR